MFGKMLRIDMTSQSFEEEEISQERVRKYLGGRGIGAKILFDELKPKTQPLSPENVLVIATGPMTGTKAQSTGRYSVVTKSPLTGAILSANSGGTWGTHLRQSGFDVLIIKGKADKPTYLWLHDGKVEFRDALKVWGKKVIEADKLLRGETDEEAKVLQIGLAGEQQSSIAAIMNDKFRAAGRGGAGAVLGSKNLKAIVVKGGKDIEVANPIKFKRSIDKTKKQLEEHPAGGGLTKEGGALNLLGTPVLVSVINENGLLPTKNFQTGVFEHAGDISGEKIKEDILKESVACFRCPIECGRWVEVRGGEYGGKAYEPAEGESLEYETVWAFGSECGNRDLDSIALANFLCNEYGLDTISTGTTIGFAMEAFEKGLITEKDVGFKLDWGDPDAIIKLVEMIAHRDGFGNVLADGSLAAARKIGGQAEEFAIQVKGLELPAYDPRGAFGIGLNYATSNRGAAHVNGYTIAAEIAGAPLKVDPLDGGPDKVGLTILFQNLTAAVDSIGQCLFLTFSVGAEEFAPLIASVMGWNDYTAEEFVKTGERIYALERLFNQREGFGRLDDNLPKRFTDEEMPEGAAKGNVNPLESMLKMYYDQRGYDEEGHPTYGKLVELDIQSLEITH
ncbi:MAG: aldehyde ferredoxin oxidoreductase [Promethearchaeota archaeon]|nr:MAG: aldehyde ferredoxin oxidoreductase [Candidatus Lokiarchaeota archaeon]